MFWRQELHSNFGARSPFKAILLFKPTGGGNKFHGPKAESQWRSNFARPGIPVASWVSWPLLYQRLEVEQVPQLSHVTTRTGISASLHGNRCQRIFSDGTQTIQQVTFRSSSISRSGESYFPFYSLVICYRAIEHGYLELIYPLIAW